MRAQAARAKRMPSFENTFRNLYLNQRVDAKSPLIPRAEWMGCKNKKTELVPKEDIYLALDLSGSTDLTSMTGLSAEGGDRIHPWFWKPEGLIKDHEKRDRVPYRLWVKKKIITPTPGRTVNHGFVAQQIAEVMGVYNILGIAFDRWRIEDLRRELDNIGVENYIQKSPDQKVEPGLRLVPWGQGFRDMAPAVDALETSILERRLQHDGNPCLTWNISNAISVSDPSGNRKLDKSKTRFRIDGVVSLAMTLGLKNRDLKPKEPEHQVIIL
jgi:phage terminase large subunit-like protein